MGALRVRFVLISLLLAGGCKSCTTPPPCGGLCRTPAEHVCINRCRVPLRRVTPAIPRHPARPASVQRARAACPFYRPDRAEFRCVKFAPGGLGDACSRVAGQLRADAVLQQQSGGPEFSLRAPACASPAQVGSHCDSDVADVHDGRGPHCAPCSFGGKLWRGRHLSCGCDSPPGASETVLATIVSRARANYQMLCKGTTSGRGTLCHVALRRRRPTLQRVGAVLRSGAIVLRERPVRAASSTVPEVSMTSDCCDQSGHHCIAKACAPCLKVNEAAMAPSDCCAGRLVRWKVDVCHKTGGACASGADCCSGNSCVGGVPRQADGHCSSMLPALCASGVAPAESVAPASPPASTVASACTRRCETADASGQRQDDTLRGGGLLPGTSQAALPV